MFSEDDPHCNSCRIEESDHNIILDTPKPYYPKPQTLNPRPHALDPRPLTVNPKLMITGWGPSSYFSLSLCWCRSW